nr:MAG TPA: hypothetical protein [Caudoviricetes sp.]
MGVFFIRYLEENPYKSIHAVTARSGYSGL